MNRKFGIALSFFGILLLATGIFTSRASAATPDCFSDVTTHWAENFICWMKDNGLTGGYPDGTFKPDNSITRAEVAVFIQKLNDLAVAQDAANLNSAKAYSDTQDVSNLAAAKAYADAQDATNLAAANAYTDTSLSTGNILISAGFGNWHPFNSTDPLSYTYFSSQTQVTRSSIGSSFLSINPDIPTVLYGKSLKFKGVEFCFDTFASTTLNYVEINTYSHTTGSLGRNLRFSDPTTRTGNECRLYTLSSPIVLTADDGVNLFIQVNWTAAASQFAIGRTTFIFEPTTTIAAAPAAPQMLQDSEEAPIAPEFDTSAP